MKWRKQVSKYPQCILTTNRRKYKCEIIGRATGFHNEEILHIPNTSFGWKLATNLSDGRAMKKLIDSFPTDDSFLYITEEIEARLIRL